MSLETLKIVAYVWLAVAAVVFVTMFFVTAPFGRHTSDRWGPTMDNRLAWVVMEAPSLLIMSYFLLFGKNSFASYAWVLFALWVGHYMNRTIIYPLRIRPTPKRMPVAIVASAIFFNLVNAGLNGYYLAELAPSEKYGSAWLASPHFWLGGLLFFVGMYVNLRSDNLLIHLRKPGETGYKVPHGFLFRYVASPNLFGEIVEWAGFAIMAWNLPALTFTVWTFANLVPRAKNHFDWNLRNIPNYPKERKVVFPFLY